MILKCQQGINTDLKKLHCSINIKCFICDNTLKFIQGVK